MASPSSALTGTRATCIGIPLWAWHQHFNDSHSEVASYLAVQDTFTVKQMGLHQIERHPDTPDDE